MLSITRHPSTVGIHSFWQIQASLYTVVKSNDPPNWKRNSLQLFVGWSRIMNGIDDIYFSWMLTSNLSMIIRSEQHPRALVRNDSNQYSRLSYIARCLSELSSSGWVREPTDFNASVQTSQSRKGQWSVIERLEETERRDIGEGRSCLFKNLPRKICHFSLLFIDKQPVHV